MQRLDRLQTATSGLASELDQSFPSLAQNSAITLSPQNSTSCAIEPLTSSKAITFLLDQNDDDAIAYLKFARSLNQNLQCPPDYGSLSADQVRAVWTLKDCSEVDIRARLREARTLCETVSYLLELLELTPTSERLWKANSFSRRLPSRVQLRPPLFRRPSAKESTRSCR